MRIRGLVVVTVSALVLSTAPATASLTREGLPYATGAAPYTVYVADFNSDGRPDVVTANGDDSTSSVFLRNAGGGFTEELGSPFATKSSLAAVGDVNGDGRPDLVVAGFVMGTGLAVRLRNAGTGFTSEPDVPFSGQASAVAMGDFTGDGRTDLAVSDWAGDNVRIFLRTPSGSFAPGATVATGANPRDVAIGDVNGDGKRDLLVANYSAATVTILLGVGDGTFVGEGSVPVGSNPTSIAVGDLDRNGRADLAVSNLGSDSVSVLLRNAPNTGFAPGLGSPIAVGDGPGQIALADLDLDGQLDIVTASASGVETLSRTGGTFKRLAPTPVGGQPSGVAVARFDGDAVPDVAVTSMGTNTLSVLLGSIPPPDPPVKGEINLIPVAGTVKVKKPGATGFVALTRPVQVPAGTQIDTRHGTVKVVGPGKGSKATFKGALLRTKQAKSVTSLILSDKLSCGGKARGSRTRAVSVKGKGKFRVRGSFSETRPSKGSWSVKDTCATTTTKVTKGAVVVRDLALGRTFTVQKGHSHVARRKQ